MWKWSIRTGTISWKKQKVKERVVVGFFVVIFVGGFFFFFLIPELHPTSLYSLRFGGRMRDLQAT